MGPGLSVPDRDVLQREGVAGDLREDSGRGPNPDSWHADQVRMGPLV